MVFVLLSRVTEKGAATLKGKAGVNREIEAFGVRVLHQYAVLGPYDFVTVASAAKMSSRPVSASSSSILSLIASTRGSGCSGLPPG